MARIKITKTAVDAATYPHGADSKKAHYLWDTSLSGFGLRVYSSGRKSYLISYTTDEGQRRFHTLGNHGRLTPDEARALAKKKLGKVADGQDPADDRQKMRETLTLAEAFALFLEQHAKPHKKSWRSDEYRFRLHVKPTLGTRKLSTIATDDVGRLHGKLGVDGPTTANRVLALLSKLFSWCELQGWLPKGTNPARGIPKFREKARERWLRREEMARLLAAIDLERGLPDTETLSDRLLVALAQRGTATPAELAKAVGHPQRQTVQLLSVLAQHDPRLERLERGTYRHTGVETPTIGETAEAPYLRAFFWTLILTGARKGEALGLRWEDVDLDRRELVFRDRKDGRNLSLPLSPPLVSILAALPRVEGNPFVFPSCRKPGAALANADKAWRRIVARAKLKDTKIHDLRRSAASWLAQAGAPILTVRNALGHATTATTEKHYAHLTQDPVRVALDELGRQIVAASKPEVESEPEAEVVPFGGRA
jgi:integrase